MSFNVQLALEYLSEGRPRINFESVKLNFKDKELQVLDLEMWMMLKLFKNF